MLLLERGVAGPEHRRHLQTSIIGLRARTLRTSSFDRRSARMIVVSPLPCRRATRPRPPSTLDRAPRTGSSSLLHVVPRASDRPRRPPTDLEPRIWSPSSPPTRPGWDAQSGLCRDCARAVRRRAGRLLRRHARGRGTRMPILPTPMRIGAPDAVPRPRGDHRLPRLRVLRASGSRRAARPHRPLRGHHATRRRREDLEPPDVSSWHGMMTSVVACGNGTLSGGFYRGVASEARLVLVKVGDDAPHDPRRTSGAGSTGWCATASATASASST